MDNHPPIYNHSNFILITEEYLHALENHDEKLMDQKTNDAIKYLIDLRNSFIKKTIYPRCKTVANADETKELALRKAVKEIGTYIEYHANLPNNKMKAAVDFLNSSLYKHLSNEQQLRNSQRAGQIPASSNQNFLDSDTLETNQAVLAEETVKYFVNTKDRKSFDDAYQILTRMIAAKIASKRSKEPVDYIAISKAALDSKKEIIDYLNSRNNPFEVIAAANILFGHAIAKIATESKEGNLPKDGILQTKPPEKFERVHLGFKNN